MFVCTAAADFGGGTRCPCSPPQHRGWVAAAATANHVSLGVAWADAWEASFGKHECERSLWVSVQGWSAAGLPPSWAPTETGIESGFVLVSASIWKILKLMKHCENNTQVLVTKSHFLLTRPMRPAHGRAPPEGDSVSPLGGPVS